MHYARLIGNEVVEVVTILAPISETYHPDVARLFTPCPSDVCVGWVMRPDMTFIPPTRLSTESIPSTKV